jgi:DNA-binding winged helix-turn-helix (wHTH) protein
MIFGFDDFELDDERLELRRAGKVLNVEALVVRLLLVLVRNPQRLLTKDELVDQVWQGRAVADNVITVSMARLRKALGHKQGAREFVVTVYGRGYRFVRDVATRQASAYPPAIAPETREVGPPFVGRERVLGRLRRALAETDAGRGRMCALIGEPGIGKTRAAEALGRELPRGQARMVWGYCREAGDTPPLWPWLRLLRDVKAAAWTPELERRLGPLAPEVLGLLRETAGRSAELPPWPWADAARHRSFDAILRTLALASEQSPLVLVFDDLHRADAASIELLGHLLDEIARTRILVIATLRHAPGRRAPRPETLLPQVLGHANCERIALDRLAPADVAAYVAALVDDPGGVLGRKVFEKSEGNPFFMSELARQLQDPVPPGAGALALPDTALDLVRQNVGRLEPETRAVLSAAAVIGRSFELSLLAAINECEPAELMAPLDEALAAEVLVAAPGSLTAFAFGHELLRAVLYDALPPPDQRRWHLRTARALEQRADAGEGVPAAELAYHFHAALPESDLRKTVDTCRAAAAAAGAVFANTDVVRYLRHALEALDLMERPSLRLRAQLLLTSALYGRADAIEFPRTISEVMRLARAQGDGRMLLGAACMLNPHPGFVPLPGGSEALANALELLAEDDHGNRATALAALAASTPQCYDAARCEELLDQSLALGRKSGAGGALLLPLFVSTYLRGGPAHDARTAEAAAELDKVAQQQIRRSPVLPAQLALHRALTALTHGDADATGAMLAEASSRCRDLRHRELIWHCERFRALARVNAGAWPEGVAVLSTLHRQAEQRSIIGTELFCAFDRVVVFGELAEQAPPLDDAVRSALDFETKGPPSIWSMKVRALAAAGLLGEARAALRAVAPGDLARLPCDGCWLGTLGNVARAALLLNALDYAEAVYTLLLPYPDRFAGHVGFLCDGSVAQLLGMLAHALGRHAPAAEHLTAGLAADERAGFAPRAAEARLQLARCLFGMDGGDRKRAHALAAEAHDAAARLGMQRLAREAAAVRDEGALSPHSR